MPRACLATPGSKRFLLHLPRLFPSGAAINGLSKTLTKNCCQSTLNPIRDGRWQHSAEAIRLLFMVNGVVAHFCLSPFGLMEDSSNFNYMQTWTDIVATAVVGTE